MKFLYFLLPFIAMSLAACPQDKDDECICIEIFQPVCGDDGVQYDNSCFAECEGVNYTDGFCPVNREGVIRDLGDPAVDGCGWVLELLYGDTVVAVRPEPLAAEFREDGLEVLVEYRQTMRTDVCGFGGTITVVEVISIELI